MELRRRSYGAKAIIQNLSSLKVTDRLIGLVDSVAANDALFKESKAFKCGGTGQYKMLANNFATLQHFKIDFWIRSSITDGATLGPGVLISKYNFSGTSSWQIQRTGSNTGVNISIYSTANTFYSIEVVPVATLLTADLIKATIKVVGTSVQCFANDVQTGSITMNNIMRLQNVPIVFNGTNQGNNLCTQYVEIYKFILTELNSSGGVVGELARLEFSGSDYATPSTDLIRCVNQSDNNATPINITSSNVTIQDYFHYLQYGWGTSGGVKIPRSAINTNLDALGNALTITQNGSSFLNSGCKLENANIQILKDADLQNLWFAAGVPKKATFAEIENAINSYPLTYGGTVNSGISISNITLKQ